MKRGTKVVITIRAGLLRGPHENRFVTDCAPGTVGVYQGVHPVKALAAAGWHVVRVGDLVAPLHLSQFERQTTEPA